MCILQILSFHWCRFLSYSCTVCMSRNVRKFSVPCVTSVTWTNLSLYLIITWRINRQHDDLTVPANAWGSIYVGLITKLSFQRIHLKKSVARSPPCCVLSHRYRYRSFNQYCSGLLHQQWGKHIVGQTIARAIMNLALRHDCSGALVSYKWTQIFTWIIHSDSKKSNSLRLLHSPSLPASGLSVGHEKWPPVGLYHPIVIGWSILTCVAMYCGPNLSV